METRTEAPPKFLISQIQIDEAIKQKSIKEIQDAKIIIDKLHKMFSSDGQKVTNQRGRKNKIVLNFPQQVVRKAKENEIGFLNSINLNLENFRRLLGSQRDYTSYGQKKPNLLNYQKEEAELMVYLLDGLKFRKVFDLKPKVKDEDSRAQSTNKIKRFDRFVIKEKQNSKNEISESEETSRTKSHFIKLKKKETNSRKNTENETSSFNNNYNITSRSNFPNKSSLFPNNKAELNEGINNHKTSTNLNYSTATSAIARNFRNENKKWIADFCRKTKKDNFEGRNFYSPTDPNDLNVSNGINGKIMCKSVKGNTGINNFVCPEVNSSNNKGNEYGVVPTQHSLKSTNIYTASNKLFTNENENNKLVQENEPDKEKSNLNVLLLNRIKEKDIPKYFNASKSKTSQEFLSRKNTLADTKSSTHSQMFKDIYKALSLEELRARLIMKKI